MGPVLALHLQSLENNPGVYPVKEGQAYLQTDYWTIIKVLNLNRIYDDLNFVISKYNEFNTLVNKNISYLRDFQVTRLHVEYIRDITVQKYEQLVPQKRFKRGLFNPLGSLIKIITGNLDYNDAVRYEKIISQLANDQTTMSNKFTLISKMLDSFINTTEVLNQNSVVLDERLKIVESMIKELVSKDNHLVYTTYIISLFNLFVSNFRTIFIKLGEIETALAFSKISILHQSIINSTELLQHLLLISQTENLIYTPSAENLVKLEETINIKSYIKQNQITFIMEIPITDNITYNYYKLYSLPIFHKSENKTFSIIPKYPYLLAKGTKYLPIIKPCRSLAAGEQFLCKEYHQTLYPEITCIEQLLKFEDNVTQCEQRQIDIENVRIQRITSTSWILFSKFRNTLTETCNGDVNKYSIIGTYVMTLDEPCNVEFCHSCL